MAIFFKNNTGLVTRMEPVSLTRATVVHTEGIPQLLVAWRVNIHICYPWGQQTSFQCRLDD